MKKIVNKIIQKLYLITNSETLFLFLLNLSTKLFKNVFNKIEKDTDGVYWLIHKSTYLKSVNKPYFNFSKVEMVNKYQSVYCVSYTPKKDDVIVDIGAGVGSQVFFFEEKIGEKGKIYSIEASPSSFKKLESLCINNKYANCKNFNLAISNTDDFVWMEEKENYVINAVNKEEMGVKVRALKLDSFVTENNITRIDFLKVNIEGAEFDMIDGMKKSISKIEHIAISCHDFLFSEEGNPIKDKVSNFLESHNFKLFYPETKNVILDSWIYAKKR